MWYRKNSLAFLLYPLSLVYRFIIFLRRSLYRAHIFKTHFFSVPVIVVGNISVGGTGKTPFVIALVEKLQAAGFRPGIITRGYRGKNKRWPQVVRADDNPLLCGDEAVLLAQKTGVPVVAGPKRVADADLLLKKYQVDVIVSDDGLQHYALARDIEIVLIDETRKFGNGFCLPAGPLREPVSRLKSVDFVLRNGVEMHFILDDIVALQDDSKKLPNLDHLKVVAIAAIGNPVRFFQSLKARGLNFEMQIFPDHYAFQQKDITALPHDIILMTEKDAVKCRGFADARCYVVRGHAEINQPYLDKIVAKIQVG